MVPFSAGATTPGVTSPSVALDADDHETKIQQLREQFDELNRTWATTIGDAARSAQRGVEDGADYVREEIRNAPLVALGIAATIGVVIALAVTQRRDQTSSVANLDARVRSTLPDVDLSGLRDRVDALASRARSGVAGLVPSVEHLVESISRMDASSVSPMIEKGSSIVRGLWDAALSFAKPK